MADDLFLTRTDDSPEVAWLIPLKH